MANLLAAGEIEFGHSGDRSENCVAERMGSAASPQAPYESVPIARMQQASSSGPNPGLAGVLGAIPFGVGAIYNAQYTKGLVHLGIFVFLVIALIAALLRFRGITAVAAGIDQKLFFVFIVIAVIGFLISLFRRG